MEQTMWCRLCSDQQGTEMSSVTDLQYGPDGLSVAVEQAGRRRSRQLRQRGHTEQNGPRHQSPKQREDIYYRLPITPLCLRAQDTKQLKI